MKKTLPELLKLLSMYAQNVGRAIGNRELCEEAGMRQTHQALEDHNRKNMNTVKEEILERFS